MKARKSIHEPVSTSIGYQICCLSWLVQHDLFDIGAELCQPGKQLIDQDYVEFLDNNAETFNRDLPRLKDFILPGGSSCVATLQLARTVCRRVEQT